MEISFSKSAISDLEDIKAYYLELDIPAVGADSVISIVEHIETLLDFPDIGIVVPEFTQNHIRELICPPYRIVYLCGLRSLQIIRYGEVKDYLRSIRLMNLQTCINNFSF